MLAILGMLFSGPQPRWATKWAWFWLLSPPLGIGYLTILLLDAPWSKRATAQPAPLPHHLQRKEPASDRRLTGGLALLIAFILAPWLVGLLLG